MADWKLVIGNKRYSTWSLRAALVVAWSGKGYEEVLIPLAQPEFKGAVARFGGSGQVPLLVDRKTIVWDSLAIAEYVAERAPAAGLWPDAPGDRAWARAIAAEMHAGFAALRTEMPMDIGSRYPDLEFSPAVHADCDRIRSIWRACLEDFSDRGPYLFGMRTIADAMFAPVVMRFETYAVSLDARLQAYADTVRELPEIVRWCADAAQEPWRIEIERGVAANVR